MRNHRCRSRLVSYYSLRSNRNRRHYQAEATADADPFYGRPRPPDNNDNNHFFFSLLSASSTVSASTTKSWHRLQLFFEHAALAVHDPTRADAVARVGELSGVTALRQLLRVMQHDPVGRQVLIERPEVRKHTMESLFKIMEAAQTQLDHQEVKEEFEVTTFGRAYQTFLAAHTFDPDARDPVEFMTRDDVGDDFADLAYVMLRYRQCHDFFHVLTGLPPTVAGELGLKWLELFQTGLPLAALSSTIGSLRLLDARHRDFVWQVYLPWAYHTSNRMKFGALMNVYYEKEFNTPLAILRERLGIVPAPQWFPPEPI